MHAPRCVTLTVSGRQYVLHHGDALEWLRSRREASIHAVVTDPPYGLLEYTRDQLDRRNTGRGGIWRNPPRFDNHERSPLPRFTVLTRRDRRRLHDFFLAFGEALHPVLVPGAHVFIATNPLVSHIVYAALEHAGFEKRGEIIRLVQTLRGGDRPKGAHHEFPDVSVMPRSGWEPWGLFRKPVEGTVRENLRRWGTGALRRPSRDVPFKDVVACPPARGAEKRIAPHPSLKPQRLMRRLVHAALPLGKGVILDPFAGSGATIAAAAAVGYEAIGIEIIDEYFRMAIEAIPRLASLDVQS